MKFQDRISRDYLPYNGPKLPAMTSHMPMRNMKIQKGSNDRTLTPNNIFSSREHSTRYSTFRNSGFKRGSFSQHKTGDEVFKVSSSFKKKTQKTKNGSVHIEFPQSLNTQQKETSNESLDISLSSTIKHNHSYKRDHQLKKVVREQRI